MKLLEPFEIDLSGINLVEASAGTGKTYNITSLYIRALIEKNISVSEILVVTYTEAATKELKDRLLGRLSESIAVLKAGKVQDSSDQFLAELLSQVSDRPKAIQRLEKAVRMFDEASIYTIHGFCYQALQEQAFESGAMYDAEMIGDDSDLVQEAVDDYWRKWVDKISQHKSKEALLKLLVDQKNDPESLARELGNYIGKPYLNILPEDPEIKQLEPKLDQLQGLHDRMRRIWQTQRSELLSLLSGDEMSNYRAGWLSGWFLKMDLIFDSDTPSIDIFDQFDRFTQSRINDSITKAAKKKGLSPPQHAFFKAADRYQDCARSLQNYGVSFKKKLVFWLRRELKAKKEDLQVLSFDDLLLRLRDALANAERGKRLARRLSEKYPLAMVDEFQDTDPNQYEIFRRIYKSADHTALFMIGDPKQSIYSFRGADIYSYIRARDDAPKANRYRLDRNFRSTPNLLRGLNAFWGRGARPFLVDKIKYKKVTAGRNEEEYQTLKERGKEHPPIQFRQLSSRGQDQQNKGETKKQVAEDTADEIRRLLQGGEKERITIGDRPVKARDIAVLVRRHKQADLISEALRERSIKSVQYSEKSVFKSEEAEQVEQLLKAVADPADETLIKTALALPLTSYTADRLLAIEDDDQAWSKLLQQFSEWHHIWQDEGFAAMYRSLLTGLDIKEHVVSLTRGERRLTNLLHLGELLHEESQQHREGTRGLLQWLGRKRRDDTAGGEEEQLRLESDEALVKVVTMHKSKGLEYPIVFCPFLWYGPNISDSGQPLVYHRPDDEDTSYLDLNGKSDPKRAEKRFYAQREELAESLRLAYVAMTRAECRLYLTWQFAKSSELSALGYLLQDAEQAEALLKAKVGHDRKVDFSGDEMHDAIGAICRNHPDLFMLASKAQQSGSEQLAFPGIEDTVPHLQAPVFGRSTKLKNSYRLSSFSSLSSWMHDEPDMPDYDQYLQEANSPSMEEHSPENRSMFTFPKGPQPGTCVHHIFEEINFATLEKADQKVTESLELHGIDREWLPTVSDMLQTVVQRPLLASDNRLRLAALTSSDLIPEMEFHYQNEHIKTSELLSIIRDEDSSGLTMRGEAESGFLKGFIDLTFRFEGKYYILDYKTNYLGDSLDDYRQQQLQQEMYEAAYDLQYHIYTIALHRFLEQKVSGYSYANHFGGAFYLFVRGMNEEGREGIFFDRPSLKTIQHLNHYIKGADRA